MHWYVICTHEALVEILLFQLRQFRLQLILERAVR